MQEEGRRADAASLRVRKQGQRERRSWRPGGAHPGRCAFAGLARPEQFDREVANAVASEVCLLFLDFLRGSRSEDDAVRGVQPFHILLTGLLGLDFGSGVKVFFCQFYTAFIFFLWHQLGSRIQKTPKVNADMTYFN